ncbi:SDR family oxidoreductase [Calidithermus roseus]|uniref:Cyclopentanol dehydrogenase n=1 Tax=Calidithermus roseus TaxID=1644118 RepID=A0A399EFH2_9DEIN|nr:SDR family oxidoreductase [Calidithermus roseus]RIH83387.1 Cyclopentanol dehydrogenase [Calidithermus roseus]
MKQFLITGASTGIGESCALYLAEKGHMVWAGVRRLEDGERLARQAKGLLHPVLLDVTDSESIARAAQTIRGQAPRLDGLVNNAGIAVAGPLEFLPLEELRRQFEVNVIGQVAVIQAFLSLLREGRGRIVNMSSISGRIAAPLFGPYSASKFALEAISDSLRRELRGWGIGVSVIEPGNIQTPIWGKGVSRGRQLLEKLPPEAKALYGRAIEGQIRYVESVDGKGLPPIEVARAVEHALTAPRPRTRYVVGREAKIGMLFARFLSDRLLDEMILGGSVRRLYGRKA